MIDISLSHANRVMQALSSSEAENYGYVEEFDSLDLKKLDHALYAIKNGLPRTQNQISGQKLAGI